MRRALVFPLLFVSAAALAQDVPVPALDRLFPKEADVTTTGAGLSRLELPADVLSQVKPDLSDVRLFDASGEEVPYFVDSGTRRGETIEVARTVSARMRNVSREKIAAGNGVPAVARERYEIELPAVAPEGGRWTLVLRTAKSNFVRAVTVEGRDANGRAAPVVSRASVFRLGAGRERLRIELPAGAPPALVLTLEGQEGDYLEPEMAFESSREIGERSDARVPLAITTRNSARGETVLELARPAGLVPDELLFESSTPAFDRSVEVWDEGPAAGEKAIGSSPVYRVQAISIAEGLTVAVGGARGDRLRVVIHDGDSPPLKDLSVLAVVRRPALVFALAPKEGNARSGVLRFGGGRAWRPAYDLGAADGHGARIATLFHDSAALGTARLGDTRDNPRFDDRPGLAFAMRAGAVVDARAWRERRVVALAPSADGLSRIRLAPADAAAARADLGDLRVIDDQSRQWPYLLDRETRREWVDAGVTPSRKDRGSLYALALPATPSLADQVSISIDSPFFDRAFRLIGRETLERRDARDESSRDITLATGRLSRRAGDPRPPTIVFSPVRLESLQLVVEDGDDAPLPVTSARIRVPLAELYVVAPAGRYSLLLGNPAEPPPNYEIASVRPVILAVQSGGADAGALEPNPQFSRTARLAQSGARDTVILWGVIGLAIVGLGGLTLRLARSPAKSGGPKPNGNGSTV